MTNLTPEQIREGDAVQVDGRGYTAIVEHVWENDDYGETWCTLDRELGDDFRVAFQWPASRLRGR